MKVRPHPIAGAAVGQLNTLLLALPLTYGPRGVRVNTVAPGATLTSGNAATSAVLDAMTATTPAGVVITPDDIARAVLFLASDDARMIHGITLPVDGGITTTRPA